MLVSSTSTVLVIKHNGTYVGTKAFLKGCNSCFLLILVNFLAPGDGPGFAFSTWILIQDPNHF